jgi:hypothetical protein
MVIRKIYTAIVIIFFVVFEDHVILIERFKGEFFVIYKLFK